MQSGNTLSCGCFAKCYGIMEYYQEEPKFFNTCSEAVLGWIFTIIGSCSSMADRFFSHFFVADFSGRGSMDGMHSFLVIPFKGMTVVTSFPSPADQIPSFPSPSCPSPGDKPEILSCHSLQVSVIPFPSRSDPVIPFPVMPFPWTLRKLWRDGSNIPRSFDWILDAQEWMVSRRCF